MKIGILYICTGKYDVFFDGFYQSTEKYLMTDTEKHYFVFTESSTITASDRIHKVYQERMGWPNDTLMRFHLFLKIEEDLKKMDYLFFFNANYTFIKPISTLELLPEQKDNNLTGQIHPVAYHKKRKNFDYERNPKSTAFIAENEGNYYFAGGLIGGRTDAFLKMCHVLSSNIDKDKENDFVAVWHDESHINAYFSQLEPKKLHPGYCYPQGWYLPFEQKTLLLNKLKLGGHNYLRGQDKTMKNNNKLKILAFKIKLYIRALNYRITNKY